MLEVCCDPPSLAVVALAVLSVEGDEDDSPSDPLVADPLDG